MITPAFEVKQNDEFVIVVIEAKFAKIAETEVYFNEFDFKFYSKPYFLRLTFPCQVTSVEECNYSQVASYDVDSGTFTIKVSKKNRGEHFEDLEFLTKLLAIPKKTTLGPCIEVVDNEENHFNPEDEDFEWHIEQNVYEEDSSLTRADCQYGFANKKSAIVQRLQDELCVVIDIRDPDRKNNEQRHSERILKEDEDFDEDHYLADKFEVTDELTEILAFEPVWKKLSRNSVEFTSEEKLILKDLPRREYLLTTAEVRGAIFGLVDLVFAYAYQHRTTLGENNVESGWTIAKLSSTLSYFETHLSLRRVLISGIRRSLIYPLYRSWELSIRTFEDVKSIFTLSRKFLLKCLLEIRSIFLDCDSRYILNDLYIVDYCVWIQQTSDKIFESLRESLLEIKIDKVDIELDLPQLEAAAASLQMEESEETGDTFNSTSSSMKDDASSKPPEINQLCDSLDQIKLTQKGRRGMQGGLKPIMEEKSSESCVASEEAEDDSDDESSEDDSDSDASEHYYLDSDDESGKEK